MVTEITDNTRVFSSFFRKSIIVFACFVIFSNYYYYYFYEFVQGISAAPSYFGFLKFFGTLLFVISFFHVSTFKKYSRSDFLLLFVVGEIVLFYFVKTIFLEDGASLFGNFALPALLFMFLHVKCNATDVRLFFDFGSVLLVWQVVLDIIIHVSDRSLWENSAFIGGVGNPSSFGIVCIVFSAYILFLQKFTVISFFKLSILCIGALGTKSLFTFLGLVLLYSYALFSYRKSVFILVSVILTISAFYIWEWYFSDHLKFKLLSLYELLTNGDLSNTSVSVLERLNIHKYAWDRFENNYMGDLFFGYLDVFYYGVDSQVLTFIGSIGLFGTFIFLSWFVAKIVAFRVLIDRYHSAGRFLFISSVIFFVMLFFNRMFDYYPVAFLFLSLIYFKDSIVELERR